jgi:acyl-CoA thioesterase I
MKTAIVIGLLGFCLAALPVDAQAAIEIHSDRLRLSWEKRSEWSVDTDYPADVRVRVSADRKTINLIVLNQAPQSQAPTITVHGEAIGVNLDPWGIAVIQVPRRKPPPTILCLGDSITAGGGGFSCYRPLLAAKLTNKAEFVGTQVTATPTGPLYHDGYGGRTVEFLAGNIERLYTANPADIILLHAGHNHFAEGKPIPGIIAATRQIIETTRRINPQVKILLAQVIPSGKLPKYEYIPELNRELAKLAGPGVILVNQAAGFECTADTVADLVHPNKQGAEKMADRWYEAILPLLENGAAP